MYIRVYIYIRRQLHIHESLYVNEYIYASDALNDRCRFCWVKLRMRAIAGGVSAGGSLALAHHFLNLVEPRFDSLAACPSHSGWDPSSFILGALVGITLVLVIQAFYTLRWAFTELVASHLAQRGSDTAGGRKVLYKLL